LVSGSLLIVTYIRLVDGLSCSVDIVSCGFHRLCRLRLAQFPTLELPRRIKALLDNVIPVTFGLNWCDGMVALLLWHLCSIILSYIVLFVLEMENNSTGGSKARYTYQNIRKSCWTILAEKPISDDNFRSECVSGIWGNTIYMRSTVYKRKISAGRGR